MCTPASTTPRRRFRMTFSAMPSDDFRALAYAQGALRVLDQTVLPWEERELVLRSAEDVAGAIRRLSVRGAPLIGVAAAYGIALELSAHPGPESLERACTLLKAARPTAVNLAWAVDRVRAADPTGDPQLALAEARAI